MIRNTARRMVKQLLCAGLVFLGWTSGASAQTTYVEYIHVASFAKNVAVGNYGGAAVDAVGVVIDVAATATPVVPGGAGAAIKAVRGADAAVDAARAGNKVANVPKPPTGKGSVPPSQRDPKRVVSNTEKREVLNNQGGNCAQCGSQRPWKDLQRIMFKGMLMVAPRLKKTPLSYALLAMLIFIERISLDSQWR